MDFSTECRERGLASALVTLAVMFWGLLQGGDLDETQLKALTGVLTIEIPVGFAYFGPEDKKTLCNAIRGDSQCDRIGSDITLLYGSSIPDAFQTALLDALAALLASVAFTGYVATPNLTDSLTDLGG